MAGSRGKKGKQASDWQVRLGIKELIFTGLGVAGLVMMSFAVGTLAGRGDIYRVMHNWGLLGPDSGKTGQIWHQPPAPPATPVVALSSPAPQELPPAAKPTQPSPQANVAAPAPPSAPVKGSIAAPAPPVVIDKKKPAKTEVKAKEDKLDKIRQEVAKQLKFQNSLDLTATRKAQAGDKTKKSGDKEPAAPVRATTSQIVVAKYRDAAQARTRAAQMQKQGDKVVLKEGKDSEGQYFAICRQVTSTTPEPHQVAQTQAKKPKTEAQPAKPAADKGTPKKKEAGR
ncbi:MAG: hypothetical protein WAU47_13025 [Desulfobaccales bacterium]